MKQPKPASPPAAPVIAGPFEGDDGLPPRVAALRAKILEACALRDVEALAVPIQWAETPPVFSRGPDRPRSFAQIVGWLKGRAFDRQGREMVAILDAVFSAPHVRITRGAFVSYGWPALAWLPPADEAGALERWRFVRFADLGLVDAKGQPLIHRAVIGADGTWHSFLNEA